ncbi:MAG: LAGLIDADG family homing endonuclease [Candidatus Vogelbacteria bacterium]|nr:LAGLIDADG family homing endonuclease [Candidatus Vogelbacteria bacterium]
MGRTKPISISADYVVGLTDGEGCFYVNLRKCSRYQSGSVVQLHFHLKMQEADKEVLYQVKNVLGCGNVYFQHENRPNHAQCYRYTVASHRDILDKIIPFFGRHQLHTFSKRKNFLLFCKIAKIVESKKHLTSLGLVKIARLKKLMNQRTLSIESPKDIGLA